MGKDESRVAERTFGGAVGVFFLSYLIMTVIANTAMAALYGAIGARGSLLGGIVVAVLWKNGTLKSWGQVVLASTIAGLVAFAISIALWPAVTQMRYGG